MRKENKRINIIFYQNGFTLPEIIISISLFTITILLVSSLYLLAQRTYNSNTNKAELSQNARVCLDRISRELRQSVNTITTIPPSNTDPLNPPVNQIFFQDGHDISQITYIRYYLDNSNLMREYKAYYFDINPNQYVFYDSLDAFGSLPEEKIIENRIIGEYFTNLKFWGTGGVINVELGFHKNQDSLVIKSSIKSRNQ